MVTNECYRSGKCQCIHDVEWILQPPGYMMITYTPPCMHVKRVGRQCVLIHQKLLFIRFYKYLKKDHHSRVIGKLTDIQLNIHLNLFLGNWAVYQGI